MKLRLFSSKNTPRAYNNLPRQGAKFFIIMILVSLVLHLLSYLNLSFLTGDIGKFSTSINALKNKPVKIEIVELPRDQMMPDKMRRIIEAPQLKTEKPKDARFLGPQDHIAEKETKTKNQINDKSALDPGRKGKPDGSEEKKLAQPMVPKARNAYEGFLPRYQDDMVGQINAGYKDYIDEELDIGEAVNLNTAEFRYIGYFTNLRKAIELIWIYPREAVQRGMAGSVDVLFSIHRDGRIGKIKIVKSSGYEILDRSILETLRLASPVAPLPKGFGTDRLVVNGSFHYVLSAYAGGVH